MANLFSDGFEDGTTDAWAEVVSVGGDLSVETTAKLHGTYGLSCLVDDATDMYVKDETPADETTYRVRFYIDPNGFSMTNGQSFVILQTYGSGFANSIQIKLQYTDATGYNILANAFKDDDDTTTVWKNGVSDAPHCVEVYWKAATGAGQNDGYIEIFIDGVSEGSEDTVDNDTRKVDTVKFGAMFKVGSGTFFLDDFASNDDGGEIGVISEGNALFFGKNF